MKTKINASEIIEMVQKSQSEITEEEKDQLQREIAEELEDLGELEELEEDMKEKVKGVYSYCYEAVPRQTREKYTSNQYTVETIRGSKTKYYIEATDEQDQPVKLTVEAQREIIEACTTLYWQDANKTVRRMPTLHINPDQTRLQETWDKYNLWPFFIFITNRPKPKPKKPTEIMRIGSTLLGAVRTAQIIKKAENNSETVAKVSMPQDVKRFLLILASRIPPTEHNTARDPFDVWKEVTFERTDLRAMQRDLYGKSGPDQSKKLINTIIQAAMTSVVNIRFVGEAKGSKPKRGEVTITPGTFIRNIKAPSNIENGRIDDDPEYICITLNNIFGYWLNRFYGAADVQSLIDRSRAKNGAEYMAIRLWGLDIAPQVAAATKKAVYSAVFSLDELGNWQQSGPESRRNMRERAMAVAAEAAKDMGATYDGTITKRGSGGEAITGLLFTWKRKPIPLGF